MFDDQSILITGGTGSFGHQLVKILLSRYQPKRLIIFSRDELKQFEMQQDPDFNHACMRFFLGDIRDCSKDSRFLTSVGYVHKDNLVGKAQFIFFSSDRSVGNIFSFFTSILFFYLTTPTAWFASGANLARIFCKPCD